MKVYKGFKVDNDGRIYCQPIDQITFYYEEGKTYECEDAKLCISGFHACTLPIDVFCYYDSNKGPVEFHEVELENISDEREYDSKIVGTKITIGRKITPDEMLDISIKMILVNKKKYFKNKPFYIIRKDTKWNFLKPDGILFSEQWFDTVYNFENGHASVNLNNKWNWLKEDGTYLSEQWFDWVSDFYNGFARVVMGNYPNVKWNYIREDETLVWNKPVEQWFDFVGDFYDGFARVKLNDKWNYLKPDGTLLSDQWFNWINDFDDGFTMAKLNDKWFKLNEKGELTDESI